MRKRSYLMLVIGWLSSRLQKGDHDGGSKAMMSNQIALAPCDGCERGCTRAHVMVLFVLSRRSPCCLPGPTSLLRRRLKTNLTVDKFYYVVETVQMP